ncbi:MAG: hypothetical protein IH985_08810 [Planctomycetes bacterium]|nr:hypothetical protein [Planctomycetota bacterium]
MAGRKTVPINVIQQRLEAEGYRYEMLTNPRQVVRSARRAEGWFKDWFPIVVTSVEMAVAHDAPKVLKRNEKLAAKWESIRRYPQIR